MQRCFTRLKPVEIDSIVVFYQKKHSSNIIQQFLQTKRRRNRQYCIAILHKKALETDNFTKLTQYKHTIQQCFTRLNTVEIDTFYQMKHSISRQYTSVLLDNKQQKVTMQQCFTRLSTVEKHNEAVFYQIIQRRNKQYISGLSSKIK